MTAALTVESRRDEHTCCSLVKEFLPGNLERNCLSSKKGLGEKSAHAAKKGSHLKNKTTLPDPIGQTSPIVLFSPSSMKSVVLLLTFSLVLHLECGGSCLVDPANAKAAVDQTTSEPPCHQHAEGRSQSQIPSNTPAHDGTSPCSQGQVIESKLLGAGKVTLPLVAIAPHTVEHLTAFWPSIIGFSPGKPPHLSLPPDPSSVLRI
jgi:hypothetical protein